MHLDDNDSELLKNWIIKKLDDISDADSDVLADYVLALVKTDDPEHVARSNCVDNLKDFLVDNAESFVNDVFSAIANKSYDPSRPAPKSAPVFQSQQRTTANSLQRSNESRKRSYNDVEGSEQDNKAQSFDGFLRPSKHIRRGGRGSHQRGGVQQRHVSNEQNTLQNTLFQFPSVPGMPNGLPAFDPNDLAGSLLALNQAMGLMPPGNSFGNMNAQPVQNRNGVAGPQQPQRCRDYDVRGFCTAGASCPYEHGDSPFVVPRSDQGHNSSPLDIAPSRVGHFETGPNERNRGSGRDRGRRANNRRGTGRRSEFSYSGPNHDKYITSIVVEQIPSDKCDEQSVRNFFGDFGDIEEVSMQNERQLAIVKFHDRASAQAAYDSPKVVFDNRFVKVYWYKPERQSSDHKNGTNSQHAKAKSADFEMQDASEADPIEVAKRQEDAQRKHEEAKKQREQNDQQKQDLDSKLKAMEAERKKMADLLAKKTDKSANSESDIIPAEDTEKNKALKEQLAKLEAEAKSLGLDPDVSATNRSDDSSAYRGRGGYRGRARGRGYNQGFRGGWGSGRGGTTGAVMRLDNRPKTVAILFPEDNTFEAQNEKLGQFLLFNSLPHGTIEQHPERDNAALVNFDQRFQGENLMSMAREGTDLPYIGNVEMSWYKAGEKPARADAEMRDSRPQTNGIDSHELEAETRRGSLEGYEVNEEENLDHY